MAIGIMISTFGCNNGLILAGARAYYAMARDGLFFRRAGQLNDAKVPAWGLVLQGSGRRSWCCRGPTIRRRGAYGNLYSNLLDYVISAALIFYILTIAGIFRLRRDAAGRRAAVSRVRLSRSCRRSTSSAPPTILLVLFVYRPATTWPGLVIVLLGVPVYFVWKPEALRDAIGSVTVSIPSVVAAVARARGRLCARR